MKVFLKDGKCGNRRPPTFVNGVFFQKKSNKWIDGKRNMICGSFYEIK